jgi:putative transposase
MSVRLSSEMIQNLSASPICINTVDALQRIIMKIKKYLHNPPHLFLPNTKYFITGVIYNKYKLLHTESAKKKLLEYIKKSTLHFDWLLEDWVILDNHYHLMLMAPENAETLSKLIGNVHRYSAIWLNKNVPVPQSYDKIWHNYMDTCITYEKSYFARLNYIWYNPVKHGYAEKPESWKYGSYFDRFKNEKEYLIRINKNYPCDKVKIDDEY